MIFRPNQSPEPIPIPNRCAVSRQVGILAASRSWLSFFVRPLHTVNTAIEIHDSRVTEIACRDGAVIVHFRPAYLHKSEGRPAFDAGTGWVQEARLIFADAAASGDYPKWPCDVMDG